MAEVPPWHPYDGCYGCRMAERINKRNALLNPEGGQNDE